MNVQYFEKCMEGLQFTDNLAVIDAFLGFCCTKRTEEEREKLSSIFLLLLSYPRSEVRKYFYSQIVKLFVDASKSVQNVLELLLHQEVLYNIVAHGLNDEQVYTIVFVY